MWKKNKGIFTGMFKKNIMEGEGIYNVEGNIMKGIYRNSKMEGIGNYYPGNGD